MPSVSKIVEAMRGSQQNIAYNDLYRVCEHYFGKPRQEGGGVMESDARPDVSHYTYRVTWSAEDDEFLATCAEFPSLSWLAPSQVDALQGLEHLLRDVVTDMEDQGEQVPQPLAERSYSGKFNVRVGESLHRELATRAAEDGLSLNQYIIRKLNAV